MVSNLRLDHAGIGKLLRSSGVRSAVADAASTVAGGVHATARGGQVEVIVGSYTTDRAAAGVTLAHPAGLSIEAKYGPLVKAAAEAGLEVRAK